MTVSSTASPASRHRTRLQLVVALTGGFLVVEVIAGILTGSLALLADAAHMLTDVGGLVLALFAIRMADRPATPARSYGYQRVEILAAAANAAALIGISLYVLWEAYGRFLAPPVVESAPMLGVAVLGLAVNVLGVWLLRTGAEASLNVKGAYFEVLSDLLASLGVVVAALVMLTTGWWYADPLISAAIGLFILPRTWILLGDATAILLEGTPADVDTAALRAAVLEIPGVTGLHDLHVWSLTSGVNAMSAHVVSAPEASSDHVLELVRQLVTSRFPIIHATLQVEVGGCRDGSTHP